MHPRPRRGGLTSVLIPAVLAAACAGPAGAPDKEPTVPAHTWLARFEDATRFFPDGMQCYLFSDYRGVADADEERQRRDAWCGRRFCLPKGFGSGGAHEGVNVEDYAGSPVPPQRPDDLGELVRPIAGTEVFRFHGTTHRGESYEWWTAFVEARFVVRATSEELLRQALRRTGRVQFEAIHPLPRLDPATVALVLRDVPTADWAAGMARPPSIERTVGVAAVTANPWSIRVWTRSAEELEALRDPTLVSLSFCKMLVERGMSDGLHLAETDSPLDAQDPTTDLGLLGFFGLWILI